MNKFIVIDPGCHTGWAIFKDRLIASGCIHLYACGKINRFLCLEARLKDFLREHNPQKAYIEQKSTFVRMRGRPLNVKAIMVYGSMWDTVNKVISEWGIVCEYLDTRKLAKKKVAQKMAKKYTKKKRINTHEAECICWGLYILQKERK